MLGRLGFPPMKDVLGGAAGLALSRLAPGLVARFAPAIPVYGLPGLAVRTAVSILAGNVASRFLGKRIGEMVTFGGVLAVADDALAMYVYPSIGLPGAMGAYLWNDSAMSAYLAPQTMGAYLTPGASVTQPDTTPSRLSAGSRL